jgi:signal transduction histidine kinase
MIGGLTGRMLAASGLLALIIGAAFAVLLLVIHDLRQSERLATHSQQVLIAANECERLLLDLETGERGFLNTGEERFLDPWNAARAAFPRRAKALMDLVARDPVDARLASQIAAGETSYIRDYSVPLVNAERRGDMSARSDAVAAEGKRRVDAIRADFDQLFLSERQSFLKRDASASVAAKRSNVAATVGLAGSILLIALFAGYLTRVIARPVRRAALMADRLAGGDLGTRMTASAPAEIGALERSFNVMADSLEKDRDELARLAEEQAALRQIATLVARGAPPNDVFAAVTEQVGRLLPVDQARMVRYESDGTITIVAGWSGTGGDIQLGMRRILGGRNITTLIWETGRPARMDNYAGASGSVAAAARETGRPHSIVGTPIVVEGRLWGVMLAATTEEQPLPPETEARLADFTDLVATAIANAESRNDLAASRARVVAAADDTRRRIERDLHDGAQQRLVLLALQLRAAQAAVPPTLGELRAELAHSAEGLAGVLDELRKIARGIHPAILAEGGLGAALRTLARRSPIPVELDVRARARLPERVEVAAYYVVSEMLTNAAKHANASLVHVDVVATNGVLRVCVSDDGGGGADPARGSGLVGLKDRVEALGGAISVRSPPGAGTAVDVELPIDD